LAPRQEQIRLLGGSNAQRDIVMQLLIAGRDVVNTMIGREAVRPVPRRGRAGSLENGSSPVRRRT
jgi:hypothetical protein